MSDQNDKQRKSKRKTLKAILGGTGAVAGASALPDKWGKPIISSVILPAHAQGTPAEECFIEFYSATQSADNEVDVSIEWAADIDAFQEWVISFSAPGLASVSGETEGGINPGEGISQEYDINFSELNPTELEATITLESGITCEIETNVTLLPE